MPAAACATIAPVTRLAAAGAARVLVVEDEESILDGLVELFGATGFDPTGVRDGALALDALAAHEFDLVVLDLMIPRVPGLEVLRRLRAAGNMVPVLVLTALGAESDVVRGLEAGADDYVTKPFGIRELVARASGLLRRASARPDAPRQATVGAVTVSFDLLSISWADARGGAASLALTAREGLILQYLVERRHRTVTREELLVDVWGYRDGTMRTRTVDVHIGQLRAKLLALPGGDGWIDTVRGRGYRFAAEVG
jgi:two-component system response regulator RegX3